MTENEIILMHILQCKPIDLIVNKLVLSEAQQKQLEEYTRRRASGEPLQYILGSWDFMGLEMKVNLSVLVPRPETEQMVERAIVIARSVATPVRRSLGEGGKQSQLINILDLGTGTGCIAIAMAKFCPYARVVAVDISTQALEVAKQNAQAHGVEDRISFVQGDMFSPVILNEVKDLNCSLDSSFASLTQDDKSSFDLIISNPPYIPTGQMTQLPKDVQQEPRLALDGGVDGLDFYRMIIKHTPHLLRKGAYLMMEFGDGQAKAILSLFDANFQVDILKDLSGRERYLTARRI